MVYAYKQIFTPNSLNFIYLLLFAYSAIASFYNFIFDDFLTSNSEIRSFENLYLILFALLSIAFFAIAPLVSKKTKFKWLHFVFSYLSGQIYLAVFILIYCIMGNSATYAYITLFSILALLSFIVLVSFYCQSLDRFNNTLPTQKDKGRARLLFSRFIPYTVNIIYLICFAALAFSIVQDSLLPKYSKISIWYDEAFLGTLVGITFFLASMIIAFVTKLDWLRFACLYLSGQLFIPLAITFGLIAVMITA